MAWFIVPYKRRPGPRPVRYCAMDDFTALIEADGGKWAETEVLGDHAIVKVLASASTLSTINSTPGFTRIPKDLLDDPLNTLTAGQRNAITAKIEELGYPQTEWQVDLGNNIGTKTLRDVLRFLTKRRKKARYDAQTDTIILDGPDQVCRSVESVDGAV